MEKERKAAAAERKDALCKACKQEAGEKDTEGLSSLLWETLLLFQGEAFETAKHLEFTYTIKGNEMFVSRRGKSITRATVNLAFEKAMDLKREGIPVTGPKKLGCFGASYLYPVFMAVGIIEPEEKQLPKTTD